MEFKLRTKLEATAIDIYNAWLSSVGHTKMTGAEANASNKPGDGFTAWDGYITGKNIELVEGKKIVQSWRTSEFKENEEDSRLIIELEEKEGCTELTLKHLNVPENGDDYIKGWKDFYFKPMKKYFSSAKNTH
jgi:Activator of HSP90 ATPase